MATFTPSPYQTSDQGETHNAQGHEYSDNYMNDIDPLLLAENPQNLVFCAEFIDGYSLRNLVEFLKTTNKKGNFIFTKDRIFYAQDNADHTVLNTFIILVSELSYYVYNSSSNVEIVGLDIGSLRAITKPIGKKDTVRLFKLAGSQFLYVQIIGQNNRSSNRTNVNVIRPMVLPIQNYTMPEYQRGDNDPNCKVPASDLAKTCNAINSIKCTHAFIRGFLRGIRISGAMGTNLVGRTDSFGQFEESLVVAGQGSTGSGVQGNGGPRPRLVVRTETPQVSSPISVTKVTAPTIKGLAKLNNLCGSGIVKFHINAQNQGSEQDDAIKLSTNISNYGRLMVYLRDIDGVARKTESKVSHP